jgi:hypothetical protein
LVGIKKQFGTWSEKEVMDYLQKNDEVNDGFILNGAYRILIDKSNTPTLSRVSLPNGYRISIDNCVWYYELINHNLISKFVQDLNLSNGEIIGIDGNQVGRIFYGKSPREIATEIVIKESKGIILSGPFKGMIWNPSNVSWGDDVASQLLGIYEEEISDAIYESISTNPSTIINLGCADGYYLIGLALQIKNAKAIGVDISQSAINSSLENAKINNVEVEMFLETPMNLPDNSLWLVDVEGAEKEIMDPVIRPELLTATMIIEIHNHEDPEIESVIRNRFNKTHSITKFSSGGRNPNKFDFLTRQKDSIKWSIVSEGRFSFQEWLFLKPIQKEKS